MPGGWTNGLVQKCKTWFHGGCERVSKYQSVKKMGVYVYVYVYVYVCVYVCVCVCVCVITWEGSHVCDLREGMNGKTVWFCHQVCVSVQVPSLKSMCRAVLHIHTSSTCTTYSYVIYMYCIFIHHLHAAAGVACRAVS